MTTTGKNSDALPPPNPGSCSTSLARTNQRIQSCTSPNISLTPAAAPEGVLEIRELPAEDYSKLVEELEAQGFRLRLDWDQETRILTIAMPYLVHEAPGEWLAGQVGWLNRELELICRCGTASVRSGGSATIKLLDGKETQPDKCLLVSYTFTDSPEDDIEIQVPYPRLVLETANSQTLPAAKRKLARVLWFSDGHVHVGILCKLKSPVSLEKDFGPQLRFGRGMWTSRTQNNLFHTKSTSSSTRANRGASRTVPGSAAALDQSSSSSTVAGATRTLRLEITTTRHLYRVRSHDSRRWGPQLLIREDPESKSWLTRDPRPGDTLPLNVYDFLRVCPQHDDPELWMPPDTFQLPLDDLKARIKTELSFRRQQIRRETLLSSAPEEPAPLPPRPPPPSTDIPLKRKSPFLELKGIKRTKP
ncbi:transmembrane protein [Ceratobasidium sp. AG-Ba]|nr:transmembrane protein [Ceratobasidium sp. AG-Ba]QRW13685.1 transmembrane protein [Ceratobasidium sp. AG-Ba]